MDCRQQFNNTDTKVGVQGNGTNATNFQVGDSNAFDFQDSQFNTQFEELKTYIEETKPELNSVVSDLEQAKKSKDKNKFQAILGYVHAILGPVAEVASIANTLGISFTA